MKDELIKEIYKYVDDLNLSDEEIKQIDIYVSNLVKYLEPVLSAQERIVNDDELFNKFKKLVKEQLGE